MREEPTSCLEARAGRTSPRPEGCGCRRREREGFGRGTGVRDFWVIDVDGRPFPVFSPDECDCPKCQEEPRRVLLSFSKFYSIREPHHWTDGEVASFNKFLNVRSYISELVAHEE